MSTYLIRMLAVSVGVLWETLSLNVKWGQYYVSCLLWYVNWSLFVLTRWSSLLHGTYEFWLLVCITRTWISLGLTAELGADHADYRSDLYHTQVPVHPGFPRESDIQSAWSDTGNSDEWAWPSSDGPVLHERWCYCKWCHSCMCAWKLNALGVVESRQCFPCIYKLYFIVEKSLKKSG